MAIWTDDLLFTSVSTDTTLPSTPNQVVLVDSTGANRTTTLPTAVGFIGQITIKKKVAANKVTIATTSSQTIDGAANFVLYDALATIMLVSDGANWQIIGGKPVRSYYAAASSTLTLTTTATDVPGATVTFTTASTTSVIVCEAKYDVETTTVGSNTLFCYIVVDGTSVETSLPYFGGGLGRAAANGLYRGTVSAGSHTVKLQGACQTAAGASDITTPWSRLVVTIYE